MRILQVASHSNVRRGGAVQLFHLVRGLRERGHEVHCVFNQPQGKGESQAWEDLRFFEKEACPITVLPLQGWSSWKRRLEFLNLIRQGGFELIHAHRDEALVFAWTAGWLAPRRTPVLVAQRGTIYPLDRLSLERAAFHSRRVVRVVAVANAVRQSLMACGVAPEKIEVVYGGVDLDRFHPGVDGAELRKELGISPEAVVFANLASLDPRKGHDIFFQASAEVSRELAGAVFLLAGEGNFRKFKPRLEALGVLNRTIYAGFRRDVEHVFAAADVVVSTCVKGEGLTGVIREAMAMGKPVIATNIAGNGEFVIDGQTGRLIPPGDIHALSASMIELARPTDSVRRMTAAGLALVKERSDNRIRCRRVEQIYCDALESARR